MSEEEKSLFDEIQDYEDISGLYEESDEAEEESNLLIGTQYDAPSAEQTFVNTKDGTVVDKKELTPLDIIKSFAKQTGNVIQDPRKSCKYCMERGYEGFDSKTKMPIPCRCLFRGKTEAQQNNDRLTDATNNRIHVSREQRRKMKKVLLKNYKKNKNAIYNNIDPEQKNG